MLRGSSKMSSATSNVTPCLSSLYFALGSSHSNLLATTVPEDTSVFLSLYPTRLATLSRIRASQIHLQPCRGTGAGGSASCGGGAPTSRPRRGRRCACQQQSGGYDERGRGSIAR